MFEHLESRRLMAFGAVISSGVLTITGTGHSETIQITESGSSITFQGASFTAVKSIVVNAGGGNDRVVLQMATSTITTTVIGGNGNDTLLGSVANDYFDGGSGNDSLVGNGGNDSLIGAKGNDSLVGGAGNDSLTGNAGIDSLLGGDGIDTVNGGADNDILDGGQGSDVGITQDVDTLRGVETTVQGNAFIPIELASAKLTIAVDVTTNRPLVTLTFASIPSTAKFSVAYTRRNANDFIFVANIKSKSEDLAPVLGSKTVTFDLGKQPPGVYSATVWSASGGSKQSSPFTVTVF